VELVLCVRLLFACRESDDPRYVHVATKERPGSRLMPRLEIQILSGQGYSQVASLCLSAPPYAAAAIYTFCIAISSDKLRKRGLFVCVNAVVTIIGCSIIGYAKNKDVRYFGCFLAIMGAQGQLHRLVFTSSSCCTSRLMHDAIIATPQPTSPRCWLSKPTTLSRTPRSRSHPPSLSVWEVSVESWPLPSTVKQISLVTCECPAAQAFPFCVSQLTRFDVLCVFDALFAVLDYGRPSARSSLRSSWSAS
jgi:hypothetical protein